MSDQPHKPIELLADKTADSAHRAKAARALADLDVAGALNALVEAAQDDESDSAVGRAAGAAIAGLLLREGKLDRIPLEDFTGAAYLGYDEVVSKHLGGARRSAAGRRS